VAIPIGATDRARYVPTRDPATKGRCGDSCGCARESSSRPQEHVPGDHADDHMSPTWHRSSAPRRRLPIAPPHCPNCDRGCHDGEATRRRVRIRQSSKPATLRAFLSSPLRNNEPPRLRRARPPALLAPGSTAPVAPRVSKARVAFARGVGSGPAAYNQCHHSNYIRIDIRINIRINMFFLRTTFCSCSREFIRVAIQLWWSCHAGRVICDDRSRQVSRVRTT
jgi:hypothetical protein